MLLTGGSGVGFCVGSIVAGFDGFKVREADGRFVGSFVGSNVGNVVGCSDGFVVGFIAVTDKPMSTVKIMVIQNAMHTILVFL